MLNLLTQGIFGAARQEVKQTGLVKHSKQPT